MLSTTGSRSNKVARDGALIYNLRLFHVFIPFSRTLPSRRDKEPARCCRGGQQVRAGSEGYHKVVNTRWGKQGRTSWITPESPRSCSHRTKTAARTEALKLLGFLQIQIWEGISQGQKHLGCGTVYLQPSLWNRKLKNDSLFGLIFRTFSLRGVRESLFKGISLYVKIVSLIFLWYVVKIISKHSQICLCQQVNAKILTCTLMFISYATEVCLEVGLPKIRQIAQVRL